VRNVAAAASELVVSANGDFEAALAARLGARFVADTTPNSGPLGGLLSALPELSTRRVFVVAGDAPFVDLALIERLQRERRDGDEAVVPAHGSGDRRRIEPLAALYERDALLREGRAAFAQARRALQDVLPRLRVRYIEFDPAEHPFANLNTPADYADFRRRL